MKFALPPLPFLLLFPFLLAAQPKDGLVIPPFKPVPDRVPQFPLKTAPAIYTDSAIAVARTNIDRFPAAARIRENTLKSAEYWLGFTYEELVNLMPDARVPRGFDLNAKGCPVHGDSVFKAGGAYPWILDPKQPFKVKCPIDGQVFPTNDFAAYFGSGFKEKKGWDTQYPDDGWGWVSPEGERYWFVAYANQWFWNKYVIPGLVSLGHAYLLTGDSRYAHQAAVMLYRMAAVYPSMDHEDQSRYGLMEKMKGNRYTGKILNRIWETGLIRSAAEVYDIVWSTIDQDRGLQALAGKSGEDLRAFIEANLLEDGLDAIADGKISGNFGMHQNSLIYLHLSRQHAGRDEAFRKLVNEPARSLAGSGIRYALYNQVFRDGLPLESPGYNSGWVNHLTGISDMLRRGGVDLFSEYRFKKLLDAPLDLVAIGKYTPDWGDGGSTLGGVVGRSTDTYQVGYRYYRDTRYLSWLGLSGNESFTSFPSLFREALPPAPSLKEGRVVDIQPSRLFAGYGLGILNDKADKTALAFTYGMHYAHYHWDFLNVELFANGQKMMPDLGYPDAMNTYVAPVYTWSSNTISHNTVVVDEKKQDRNLPGTLHDFADGKFARNMDASSPAYSQTTQYRRNLVMVDADSGQSYVVDFFHVAGGRQHDYSLHGPPGEVFFHNWKPGEKQPGTLAGAGVALEEIYDDEDRRLNGAKRGYSGYKGSGFQHLFNVQRLDREKGLAEYRHTRDSDARIRLHLLSDAGQEVYAADAYDKPRGRAHVLKYLVTRRKAAGSADLSSTFVALFEPYKGENPLIKDAAAFRPDEGEGHAVRVVRPSATEIILYDTTASVKKVKAWDIETDATTAVATFGPDGRLIRLFFSGGRYFNCRGQKFTAEAIEGKVEKVEVENRKLYVSLTKGAATGPEPLSGRIAHFTNTFRTTVHPLLSVSRNGKRLEAVTSDDILVGKLRLDKAEEDNLHTATSLSFSRQYNGTDLLTEDFRPAGRVRRIEGGSLEMAGRSTVPLRAGDELWLSNITAGDLFMIRPVFSWTNEGGK